MNAADTLEKKEIRSSVPCRVDFGGTLDISTFFLPLHKENPSTLNIALDMRTHVVLAPFEKDQVKISSKGFETAVFKKDEAPFNHPMGLMFAIAQFFDVHGVHIHIESTSPPRSALGGSSSAAVAIIAAFNCLREIPPDPGKIAMQAHYIEASVAGVPCGLQDQLAAAFGGVNQWVWKMGDHAPDFEKVPVAEQPHELDTLNRHILVAYCGIDHVSKDINSQWVQSFVSGRSRKEFKRIAHITTAFAQAVKMGEFELAGRLMNEETGLRLSMTPDVLDNTGKRMFEKAKQLGCGARFTGAGGGGCLWAIGEQACIDTLKYQWQEMLNEIKHAKILDTKIENKGIITA